MVLPRSLVVLLSLSSLRSPCCRCSGVRRQSTPGVSVYLSVEVPPQGAVAVRLRIEDTVLRLPPGAGKNLASLRLLAHLFVVVLLSTADWFRRRPWRGGHAVLACPGFLLLLDGVPSSVSASPPSPKVLVPSAYRFVARSPPGPCPLVALLSLMRPRQWRGRSSSALATSFLYGLLCGPLLCSVGRLLRRCVSFRFFRRLRGVRGGLLLGRFLPLLRLRFRSQ
jgi:hypothetical protein